MKELNVSSFNTNNVKVMSGMFLGWSSLKYLDISSFTTNSMNDKVYFQWMFLEMSRSVKIKCKDEKINKLIKQCIIF